MACNVYVITVKLFIGQQPVLKEFYACELLVVRTHTHTCVYTFCLHKACSHALQITFSLSVCYHLLSVCLCVCL